MNEKHPPRGEMLRIVERQLGHITRGQLLALGATPRWIEGQRLRRALISVHAGVYALGHVPRHGHGRAMAAVLACGEGAALSHRAAAALWGVREWPAALEVSSLGYHRRPGLITHRVAMLAAGDLRTLHGVRVTSPARTVLDLRSRLTDPALVRLVNDLRAAEHLRATAFAELCARSRRIDGLLGDGDLTRSELEDLFRRFVTRHRLPMPEINATLRISGTLREVDALYREARLIIELDSWRFHGDRASFERDRAKDATALAEAYQTLRPTARRLTAGGDAEARTIRAILAAAGFG